MLKLNNSEILAVNGAGCGCVTGNDAAVTWAAKNDLVFDAADNRIRFNLDDSRCLYVRIDHRDHSTNGRTGCIDLCCEQVGSNHWFWGASLGQYGKCVKD